MPLLTISETAQRLRRSPRGVYDLLFAGSLQAVKVGGRTFITDIELDRFEQSLPVAEFKSKTAKAAASPTAGAGERT